MKSLIAYATKYGCAQNCAKTLCEKIKGEVELCNLKKIKDIDLSNYDSVIIGGSIYMGKIQKEVKKFCEDRISELREKKVGLFICCMGEEEVAQTQLNNSFPQELINVAIAKENFGGEFILDKMKSFDKFIVKKVSKVEKDTSNVLDKNIELFAKVMN